MRYDRPFILPEPAGDGEGEAEEVSPPDAGARKARLNGRVVMVTAVVAVALGMWIWRDGGRRVAHSAPEQTPPAAHRDEPSTAAEEPALPLQSQPQTASPADDRAAGAMPATMALPTTNAPPADEPTNAAREAQIIEAIEQGQYYTTIGRNDVAASHYAKAAELDPGNASVRYELALAYVRSGQTASARREMAKLKELDPSLASLLANLLR